MTKSHSKRVITSLLLVCWIALPFAVADLSMNQLMQPVFGVQTLTYGDTNVERYQSTISGDTVQAYARIAVNQPITITTVSLFLQYSGSYGNQCIKFGIYKDGNLNPAGQPLVAATKNGYCLYGAGTYGPTWQTWSLSPSDQLAIKTPGTYWLCVLGAYSYGNIFHSASLYGRGYNQQTAYSDFFFLANYTIGFPSTFNSNPAWETQAPFSIYVQAVPATGH